MQTFKVEGMTCAHCERAVTDAIHSVDNGAQVNVDLAAGTVGTNSQVRPDLLIEAISAEGYKAQSLAAQG
ncbi:MAG: heavy-metal-associated domain-containing protein [Proteobacteria bacterium]|nr:heavy-metal-associated domain-containing protein [Pseudomonadota bacterium]OYV38655.1 MAG: copper resistance protein CopZ [Rhodospirillales bacterium 20-64-7]HQT76248.1 heavy-metal-associated domain-containing protein [Rhodopila sp.]